MPGGGKRLAKRDKLSGGLGLLSMNIKPVYILTAILAIATLYFYQDPGSNGNARLGVVRAVVERGGFQIDTYQQDPAWVSVDKAYHQGHYYGDKAIGSWLVAVPIYFLLYKVFGLMSSVAIKHSLTALIMGSAFTINGIVLYQIAGLLTQKPWKALLAALAVSLGTMLWPYSVVYYGHVLAAMFVSLAFYALFRIRATADAGSRVMLFASGLAMGFAFITDYTTAFIIIGLIVYAIYVVRARGTIALVRAGLWGLLGAAIPLALLVGYNLLVYKVPLAFGYSYETNTVFTEGIATGIMGFGWPSLRVLYHITVDPQFGLFWQSPVLVMAFVGLVVSFGRREWHAEVLLAFYALASLLLMNAGYYMWWGGFAFGPRFLIVGLPLMVIPLALVPDKLDWLLAALGALSAGQMLIPLLGSIGITINYDAATDQFAFKAPFTRFSILYQYGIPLITRLHRNGTLPWNLGTALGLSYRAAVALFVGIEAALIGSFYLVTRPFGLLRKATASEP